MPRNLIRVVLAATLLLSAGSAGAITWQVRMHSGRVFETRYMPLDAAFDDTMITFLSDQGNYVALVRRRSLAGRDPRNWRRSGLCCSSPGCS